MICRKCLVLSLPVTCREGLSPGKGFESGFYHLEMSKTSKITFSIRVIWKFFNFFLSDFRRFLGAFWSTSYDLFSFESHRIPRSNTDYVIFRRRWKLKSINLIFRQFGRHKKIHKNRKKLNSKFCLKAGSLIPKTSDLEFFLPKLKIS